ncbi:hypothetical protein Dimus_034853 [Dionaea muscipula]
MEVDASSFQGRRVGFHRDFPPGFGSVRSGYGLGSAPSSFNRDFPHGFGPREPPVCGGNRLELAPVKCVVPETERQVVSDSKKSELVPAKRGGQERQPLSGPKKLAVDKIDWRRPVGALRSKPATEMVSTTDAAAAIVKVGKGGGKGNENYNVGLGFGSAREEVMETLKLFRARCWKLQGVKSNEKERRIDLQAKKELIREGKIKSQAPVRVVGAMPGVEVGDEFYYRVELFIIGLHGRLQNGIDYIVKDGTKVATCVVATEGYHDDMHQSDTLMYIGEGGFNFNFNFNFMDNKGKRPEDQKMKGGNLALKNSFIFKSPVRVVRGIKLQGVTAARQITYVYDGLYDVTRYDYTDKAKGFQGHGNMMYQFELRRCPGQPLVRWKKYKH